MINFNADFNNMPHFISGEYVGWGAEYIWFNLCLSVSNNVIFLGKDENTFQGIQTPGEYAGDGP